MAFFKKVASSLRNAFSYAAHLESADDRARKPAAVEKLLSISVPPEGADVHYHARLHALLMSTPTQPLEALARNGISVVLDSRLRHQVLDGKDQRIDGIFYDAPGARTVAIWDDGAHPKKMRWSESPADHGPVMLAKLAEALSEGKRGDMMCSRYASLDCWMGVGVAACVTYTSWVEVNQFDPGAKAKNPALALPPKKRVVLKP